MPRFVTSFIMVYRCLTVTSFTKRLGVRPSPLPLPLRVGNAPVVIGIRLLGIGRRTGGIMGYKRWLLALRRLHVPVRVKSLMSTLPQLVRFLWTMVSVGGRLIDAWLSYTNGLLAKALVPVAQCISDIGERKVNPVNHYLDGLNNSLRLLTSAVSYLNQLWKEVHDSALADICKWDCEVGTAELFPFDVLKK